MSEIIQIKEGRIRGFSRNGHDIFLGIPYGTNCDGENRFRPAKPHPSWEGILECTKPGNKAVQGTGYNLDVLPEPMKSILEGYLNHFTGGIKVETSSKASENCLFLNVATPNTDDKKRPVMFYIHGGAYMSGGGDVPPIICDKLLDEEDVVVVSVNHRLNVFGYLYLGGFDSAYNLSGIVGQLDLILALQWVKDNIAFFGGNPDNVTLIGESGGGMKISTLLAMPKAQGLFHKAIVMSGAERVGIKSKEQGHKQTLQLLKVLGIEPENWKEILHIPAEKLYSAVQDKSVISDTREWYCPVADGEYLAFNEEQKYLSYECSKDVSLMVGASEDELVFAGMSTLTSDMTWDDIRTMLLEDVSARFLLPRVNEDNVDALINVFRFMDDKEKAPCHVCGQILSTAHFLGGGAYWMAIAKAKQKAPVYFYSTAYDFINPGMKGVRSSWHTADLPLVFRAVFHPEDEVLSKTIASSFAAFARSGSPESVIIDWKEFTEEHKYTMLFDEHCRVEEDYYKKAYAILFALTRDTFTILEKE